MVNLKQFRINLADKLEAWGKRNGLYAVPMVSTNGIKNEMLRKPWFTSKENHIKKLVRKFAVTQPASIGLILSEIEHTYPNEYYIASSEFDAIKFEATKNENLQTKTT